MSLLTRSNSMHTRSAARRRAFTLVEMIVVTVMIAIFATVTTVRMSNLTPRRAAVTVKQVANLLDALAHRQIVSQSPVALVYDDRDRRLWIEHVVDYTEFESSNSGRPEASEWTRDIIAPVIQFDDMIYLDAVYFDSSRTSGSFRREFPPSEARPLIEFDIAWPDHVDTVTLLPGEQRALRSSDLDEMRPRPEDLDESGVGDETW